jgi:hypothetical protein
LADVENRRGPGPAELAPRFIVVRLGAVPGIDGDWRLASLGAASGIVASDITQTGNSRQNPSKKRWRDSSSCAPKLSQAAGVRANWNTLNALVPNSFGLMLESPTLQCIDGHYVQ